MSSPSPVLTTIIFVFAAQAIILSILIYRKKPKTLSHSFLSLLVFFFALMALNIALVNVLISYDLFHVFRYVQLELLFGIGPGLYFYSKSISDQEFQLSKKNYLHFVPVLLEFVFYRTAFYRLGADGMYETPAHPYTKIYLTQQWLGIISISAYTIYSLKILYDYQHWLKQNYSNTENRSLKWLRVPIVFFAFFWIGWNLLTEIDRFVFERALRDYYFLPAFVGLAIVTCWIGFKGYLKTMDSVSGYSMKKASQVQQLSDPDFKNKLEKLMIEEKPFLDPDLDLKALATALGMKPKLVSFSINEMYKMNFYDLINRFRIESFKERLIEPESSKLTLLGLALESGFNSKSTFNLAFKKATGETPSQFAKGFRN